jgi:hypothetical protein
MLRRKTTTKNTHPPSGRLESALGQMNPNFLTEFLSTNQNAEAIGLLGPLNSSIRNAVKRRIYGKYSIYYKTLTQNQINNAPNINTDPKGHINHLRRVLLRQMGYNTDPRIDVHYRKKLEADVEAAINSGITEKKHIFNIFDDAMRVYRSIPHVKMDPNMGGRRCTHRKRRTHRRKN